MAFAKICLGILGRDPVGRKRVVLIRTFLHTDRIQDETQFKTTALS